MMRVVLVLVVLTSCAPHAPPIPPAPAAQCDAADSVDCGDGTCCVHATTCSIDGVTCNPIDPNDLVKRLRVAQ